MTSRLLDIARTIMTVPTAPFREAWICAALDALLADIPALDLSTDPFGNRYARLNPPDGDPDAPPLVFVAHLDHPGFLVEGTDPDTGHLRATFEGRVRPEFFPAAAVRLFRHAEDPGIRARVAARLPETGNDNMAFLLDPEEDPTGAVLAMWDVPAVEVRDGVLFSRACDDLAAVAAIVRALEVLAADPSGLRVPLIGMFTRAEEAGFCGALAIVSHPHGPEYLPRDADIISVENSSVRPGVVQGAGPVLRTGDRATSFDQNLLHRLNTAMRPGGRLAFQHQRALMDAGTCEASAFAAYGYRAAGICIPLANYHNMDLASGTIAPESIHLADFEGLETMIRHLAVHHTLADNYLADLQQFMAPFLAKGLSGLEAAQTPSPHSPNPVGEKK